MQDSPVQRLCQGVCRNLYICGSRPDSSSVYLASIWRSAGVRASSSAVPPQYRLYHAGRSASGLVAGRGLHWWGDHGPGTSVVPGISPRPYTQQPMRPTPVRQRAMHYRSSAVLTPCMDGMARCARHGMEDPRTYGSAWPGPPWSPVVAFGMPVLEYRSPGKPTRLQGFRAIRVPLVPPPPLSRRRIWSLGRTPIPG
jgi:hypothetical protein